jgi:hypothetical protein
MKATKPKFNYKIFNLKTKKFISNNRKSTWVQKTAIIDFINNYGRSNGSYFNITSIDDLEIHIFPMTSAIITSAYDFLLESSDEIKEKENKKLEIERKLEVQRKEYKIQELKRKLNETEKELNKLTENKI